MECLFSTCRKPADDQFTCDNCYIPKYCSYQCKRKDSSYHETWCRPSTFSLKDFIPVKTSRKLLDVGTYGEVQLMQNTSNSKLYALKIIRKSLVSNIIPLKVLFREIMIHKTLIHPNIVRLVDHFEDITKIYLVLEFVEKGSLFDLIRRKIKLSESEACEIFVQTCTGLNYLHQNDIVHRDIKPENLLISKTDTIKICDFGWSAPGSEKKVTFCGTLDYMSPEMINSEPHSTKVDVWALGILLYEMLHGCPPYSGKNPKEQYRLIASGNITIGSHVSKTANQLIKSILHIRPNDRPSIIEILRSQWVQEYSESQLQRNWKVNKIGTGDGFIVSIVGKVVNLNFKGKAECMLEAEVLRKCVIYDENNRLVHTPPDEESRAPRFDPTNSMGPVNSLYKKLGIDSGRATPISGRNTPVNGRATPTRGFTSRSSSRRGSIIESISTPTARTPTTPKRVETSPKLLAKTPTSKSSPFLPTEESKKIQGRSTPFTPQEPKSVSIPPPKPLSDFENISLQAEIIPATIGAVRTKPKSSFLARFKAK